MRLKTLLTGLATAFGASAASAQDLQIIGQPHDGEMGFQPQATELMRDIVWLDTMVLVIITVITIFVLGLLLYCIVRFNERANPTPAGFTHNTPIEVAWTVIPIVILVFIGAFSLPVLFKQQEIPEPDVFIKATGNKWFWDYEYPDEEVEFSGFMIDGSYKIDDDAAGWDDEQEITDPQVLNDVAIAKLEYFGYSRDQFLLATDTAVVIPTGKTVVVQVTGSDVIHAWAIPAFGVKQDAVPGRLAELWFEVDEGMEGIYFGQCSELCGQSHAFMPITVKAVTQAEYEAWVNQTKVAGAYVEPGAVQVAASE